MLYRFHAATRRPQRKINISKILCVFACPAKTGAAACPPKEGKKQISFCADHYYITCMEMTRKRILWIILLSAVILLVTGLASSYYWIANIYLPEQMDAHSNSRLLLKWEKEDLFVAADNAKISEQQFIRFLQINESLSNEIQKLRKQFEENSWLIAFEVIKIQPEWAGKKYLALKKFNLSPKEYNWIADSVIEFWIYKWKKESVENLRDYGWELESFPEDSSQPVNYELFTTHEDDLNRIFDLLWPETSFSDSIHTTEQTLP
jgi:hypothetical protein